MEDWIKEPEAAGIVKMVGGDDGVEAFRQLKNRFDPPHCADQVAKVEGDSEVPRR